MPEVDDRLKTLKVSFSEIKGIRDNIIGLVEDVNVRVSKLNRLYADFVDHNKKTLFVFGLDSFYFQGKLIDAQFADVKKYCDLILNRMYCEYYKLFIIVADYSEIHQGHKVNKDKYPVYKDLEPRKQYSFDILNNLHNDIVDTLSALSTILKEREKQLLEHKSKSNIGLNINNFVSTFEYDVAMLKSQIILYIDHLDFFHKFHKKYLKSLTDKVKMMQNQINNDIKFDELIVKSPENSVKEGNEGGTEDVDSISQGAINKIMEEYSEDSINMKEIANSEVEVSV